MPASPRTPETRPCRAWQGPDAGSLYRAGPRTDRSTCRAAGTTPGLRQVRHSGASPVWQLLATVELVRRHPGARRSRGGPDRGVPLAARLAAADAGATGPRRRRPGVPPGARHRVVAAGRLAARGPDPAGAAPAVDRGRRCTWPRSPPRGPGSCAAVDPAYAGPAAGRRPTAYAAAQRHPRLIAPDDHGAFGGGPYGDDDLDDDFYWAAAELWLATGERPTAGELGARLHTADAFDLTASTSTGSPRPPGSTSRWPARPAGSRRGGRRVLPAPTGSLELQRLQPWGQPYAPAGAGAGAPTAGS